MVEVEKLGCSVFNLLCNSQLMSMLDCQGSVLGKSRDDIEWSISIESTILINTRSWLGCFLIKIDNFPSLIEPIVLTPNYNIISFFVCSSSNVEYLVILDINEVLSSVSELFPPVLSSSFRP